MYRESQISSEKSNLGLYLPNNPLEWLFQKIDIRKSSIALHLENFRKARKFSNNTIFIYGISQNLGRFQRNSMGAKKLLRIIIIVMAFLLLLLFLFLYIKHFLSYLRPFVFLVTFCLVEIFRTSPIFTILL